jgi:hypothetical protein
VAAVQAAFEDAIALRSDALLGLALVDEGTASVPLLEACSPQLSDPFARGCLLLASGGKLGAVSRPPSPPFECGAFLPGAVEFAFGAGALVVRDARVDREDGGAARPQGGDQPIEGIAVALRGRRELGSRLVGFAREVDGGSRSGLC